MWLCRKGRVDVPTTSPWNIQSSLQQNRVECVWGGGVRGREPGGAGGLEPPHFSIRGAELPQNWTLSRRTY